METIQTITYAPAYQSDFKRINLEWISEMFAIEPHDLEQLDHPEAHILPNNGAILLAKRGDEVLGTVALINTTKPGDPLEYELAKMAVSKTARGFGIGRVLCEAAVDAARQAGAKRLWLESNRKAAVAVQLYLSVGFVHIPLRPSPYTRADVCMEMIF